MAELEVGADDLQVCGSGALGGVGPTPTPAADPSDQGGQAATLPISALQCLHLVALGFRSSERHAGHVLVGGGSANTVLPMRAMTYL